MTNDHVIRTARDLLLATLAPLVADSPAIALLDFPSHGNVGDSAIWLGALAALRAVGAPPPAYTCDADTYDRNALARAVGHGTILLLGGGNFGDLWERHQLFRERVVADFPRNRIVQLPQSVHFQRADALARARAVFDAHERLTLLVRDAGSLDVVRREFRATSHLVPDIAMTLGPLARSAPAARDILWLKRADQEDCWPGEPAPCDGDVEDWLNEERTPLIRWSDRLRYEAGMRPWLRPVGWPLLAMTHHRLSTQRLARGVNLLSSARVIVTDRLHGHIVSLLLGIPHVVLDNSYGKLHRFVAAWTSASPLVKLAQSPAEATAHARAMLRAADG